MARKKPTPSLDPLTSLLPRDHIEAEASRFGVFRRKPRKIDLYLLVWTLIIGLPKGPKRTLDGLRVAYEEATGQRLARSSFYTRLNKELAKLMKSLVVSTLETCQAGYDLPGGFLAGFVDVLALDASVLSLHDLLATPFAATRTNHTKAAAKLHMVMSVLSHTPVKVKLSAERVGDTIPWKRMGKWVGGCLLLFDLGYYEFHLFDRIDQNKGFFLSRAKSNFNPKILSTNRAWRGRAVPVVGERLKDVLPRLERGVLDVNVEVSFNKRNYKGKQTRKTRAFRLVAVKNEETGKYHVYITNLPPDRLSAEDITRTYAVRWQVELFFKMMKSHMNLSDLPSSKRHIVEILIWSSVLLSIVSGRFFREVRRAVSRDRHIPLLRWGRVFTRSARDLLRLIVRPDEQRAKEIIDLIIHEAPDPNRRRAKRSLQEVPYPLAA